MIRKVKAKERKKAGNIYCDHCKPEKVHAVWRETRGYHEAGDFACDDHKHLIKEESADDGHMSEADYQTWGTL